MATATFFGAHELRNGPLAPLKDDANGRKTTAVVADNVPPGKLSLDDVASLPFPREAAFMQQAHLVDRVSSDTDDDKSEGSGGGLGALQYCHLAFHTQVIAPPSSVVLGSRLDSTSSKAPPAYSHDGASRALATLEHCRIAFHGRLVLQVSDVDGGARTGPGDVATSLEFGTQAGQLRLFTEKIKTGVVFRVGADGQAGERVEVFGKDLFKKETNISPFVGMILLTEVCDTCVQRLYVFRVASKDPSTLPGSRGLMEVVLALVRDKQLEIVRSLLFFMLMRNTILSRLTGVSTAPPKNGRFPGRPRWRP